METNIDIYNNEESCNIKAKVFFNADTNNKTNRVFIFCHGFCSGKGSNSIRVVANMLLKYGITSISFDFPGHVDSIQGTDKLTVNVCISYINSVVEYVKSTYGEDVKISFYAISFGAYVLLNKLIGDNSSYENIILRSPAFNMKAIFVNSLLKESFKEYKKNGFAKSGHDGKLIMPYSFYNDLLENDLYKNYKEKRKILIIQGTLDDTAPISDTYDFIRDKVDFELIEMKNMRHHMTPEEIGITVQEMLKRIKL